MQEYQEKARIRRILYSKPVLVLLVVICVFLIKAGWSAYFEKIENVKKLTQANEELANVKTKETNLKESIDRLKTTEGIEAEIRDKYKVVKPGEKMLIIVDGEKPAEAAPILKKNFFQEMWSKIISVF